MLEPEELDDRYFMLRVRIDGGQLSAAQLRAISDVSVKYGRGTADVTDRQNVQLHWIEIESVPAIWEAINERQAGRVYVCNLATQDSETKGLDADAHLAALAAHRVTIDTVVCDPSTEVGAPSAHSTGLTTAVSDVAGATVVTAALARPDGHSHDPALLSDVLSALAAAAISPATT